MFEKIQKPNLIIIAYILLLSLFSACKYNRTNEFSRTQIKVVDEQGHGVEGVQLGVIYGYSVSNFVDRSGFQVLYKGKGVTNTAGDFLIEPQSATSKANLLTDGENRKIFSFYKAGYQSQNDRKDSYDSASCLGWYYLNLKPYWYSEYGENTFCNGNVSIKAETENVNITIRKLPTCREAMEQLKQLTKEKETIPVRSFQLAQYCFNEWNPEIRNHPEILSSLYKLLDGSKEGYSTNFYQNYLAVCALGYLDNKKDNIEKIIKFYDQVKTYNDGGNASHLRDLAFLSIYRLSEQGSEQLAKLRVDYLKNCKDVSGGDGHRPHSPSTIESIQKRCDEWADNPEVARGLFESDSPCATNPRDIVELNDVKVNK